MEKCDVLIIGSGMAGLVAAIELADLGLEVIVLSSDQDLFSSNSAHAQGGIIYQEKSSNNLLVQDMLRAGSLKGDKQNISTFANLGSKYVKELLLEKYNIPFSKNKKNTLAFTKEAAHSEKRIIHHQDTTGKAIIENLFSQIKKRKNIQMLFSQIAIDLIQNEQKCIGASIYDQTTNEVYTIFAKETILATGGVGELYLHTSNSKQARGDGIAIAFRAGVICKDLEFVQFHPTTLFYQNKSQFLLTEALRGEGAKLLDANKKTFMEKHHPLKELAPRDIVSRAIFFEMKCAKAKHIYLDISFQKKSLFIKKRFPYLYYKCLDLGLDISKEPVPVVPAAHYMCGGIKTDLFGKTSLKNLYAIGEVACTSIHGANRLASTSLLECLVLAKQCANDIYENFEKNDLSYRIQNSSLSLLQSSKNFEKDWQILKTIMWTYVGLVRNTKDLKKALSLLQSLKEKLDKKRSKDLEAVKLGNAIITAILITKSALCNTKSIGCHYISN